MKYIIVLASLLFWQQTHAQKTENNATLQTWSFQDCVTHALENNISIKDAVLSKNIASVTYQKSKDAKLPNLFGSATQSFSSGNTIDPITSDFVTEQVNSTNVGITSSVTLFQGNQLNNQITQNKIRFEQTSLLAEEVKNNIVLNLLENYLQALFSKEDIAIAENNLKATEKELKRAKARLDAGEITLGDYSEVQSQAATNKYTIITAKNNYQQYIIVLKQLLELDPVTAFDVKPLNESKDVISLSLNKLEIYKKALGYLPELAASNLNIAANKKEEDIAKGAFLPILSLSGSLGSGYTSINSSSFTDQLDLNFNQRLGLTLSIPIFNRNATKAAVKTAQLNVEKAEIEKQTTTKTIYKKVETAYQNAMSAQEQLVAAQAAKEAAEQSYTLALKKYELGALNTTDFIISQNVYTNAQQNYIQAKYLTLLYHQLLQFYQGNTITL
ncbi:TolC family protein [Polaribacter sp. Z022]|uniref:TolC family protein n=1 Tax=Polaribacter sp. Z022 TaxID=2927125 RepID=UPI0020228E1F|nr:TolC family protein [Polaribacter sp. Z022]MCL7754842.1 TolC family protein [Polaribacter sp. Z022]